MKKILIAVFALVCAASLVYAAEGEVVKATEPVGAVVETGGVFVGKITNVIEESMGAGKGSLVLADDNGRTKIFPLDPTVKVLDTTFNALTLNQLKQGEKVSVKYTKDASGQEKATSVQVMK